MTERPTAAAGPPDGTGRPGSGRPARGARGGPLDPDQIAALAAVVEAGSFEAAAAALHVTPSAVSQRVKALEQRVGAVLVRRSRPCTATPSGLPFVRLAGQWALLEAEARRHAGTGAGGSARVPVAVNADSLSTWFPPALAALVADEPGADAPDVLVEVHREDQDHSARLLRDGSVMAAVTADPAPVQGCAVRPLGAMRYLAVAAPAYLARRAPDGATAEALATAPLLAFNDKDALQQRWLVQALGLRAAPPTHLVPSSAAFVDLVRLGLGWGMVPDGAAAADLAAGRLVELVPGSHLDVALHWQHWRLGSSTLERLTAAVLEAARAGLHT